MLEAKDQGHNATVLQNAKKGLHKNFCGDLKKKGLQKSFSGELQKKRPRKKFFSRSTKF